MLFAVQSIYRLMDSGFLIQSQQIVEAGGLRYLGFTESHNSQQKEKQL